MNLEKHLRLRKTIDIEEEFNYMQDKSKILTEDIESIIRGF